MNCKYCKWKGVASVEDNELARCPRCGEDTEKSLWRAIAEKDTETIEELENKAKKGEIIRII